MSRLALEETAPLDSSVTIYPSLIPQLSRESCKQAAGRQPAEAGQGMVAPKPKLLFANEGRWFDLLAPAFCIVYFLLLAGNGLNAFFSGDDIQNLVRLHDCFHTPLLEIAQQALTVVSGAYRPVGGLFYRSIYAVFGFDPLPFRIAAFALMGVNLLLAYRLARILSASRYAALAATFLLSCNASFVEMYHSTGMIYDILCFGFFAGAFLIYAAVRSRGSHLGKGRICCVFILYCLALGSKEIAVAFPAALLLYELVYHPYQFRRRDILAGLRKSHLGAIAGLSVLTAAYAAVKLLAGTHIAADATYKLEISFGAFAASLDHYLPHWLYLGDIDELETLAIAAGAGIAAYALRAKALMFGISLMIVTFLPVAFIPLRGTFAFYLPSLGCALFLGSGASLASEKLLSLRLFDRADSIASRRRRNRIKAALQGIGFLVFAAFATPAHHTRLKNSPIYSYPLYSYLEQSRDVLLPDLKAMHPNLPKGATIYFEDDPYPKNLFSIVALIRLAYDDPTLRIDRRKVTGRPSLPYDFAFTFARGGGRTLPASLAGARSCQACRLHRPRRSCSSAGGDRFSGRRRATVFSAGDRQAGAGSCGSGGAVCRKDDRCLLEALVCRRPSCRVRRGSGLVRG